jgi:hypothetical protein
MQLSDSLGVEISLPPQVNPMKRFLLVIAALALFASSEAQAAQRYYYRSAYRPARTYNYNYNSGYSRSQAPFSRLMELERAKNAWLRQTFLGY